MSNYTQNEWKTCQTTLKTSRIHVKLRSKRVENMSNYTRNGWKTCQTTLETSGKHVKLHSKRVENLSNYTRNEWRTSNQGHIQLLRQIGRAAESDQVRVPNYEKCLSKLVYNGVSDFSLKTRGYGKILIMMEQFFERLQKVGISSPLVSSVFL